MPEKALKGLSEVSIQTGCMLLQDRTARLQAEESCGWADTEAVRRHGGRREGRREGGRDRGKDSTFPSGQPNPQDAPPTDEHGQIRLLLFAVVSVSQCHILSCLLIL